MWRQFMALFNRCNRAVHLPAQCAGLVGLASACLTVQLEKGKT